MSWATQRRFVVLLIAGVVAAALLFFIFTKLFYTAPSCVDGIQNQNETGVDCGGSCPYLCNAALEPPTVLFTQSLTNVAGRTDVIASVENKNATAAAKDVPYTITLYGTGRSVIQTVSGTFDLPAGATEPVYMPGISSGKQAVTHAFLTIDPSAPKWFSAASGEHFVPTVSNTTQTGTADAPRVEAVLTNPSVTTLSNVQVIVFIRGGSGDIIAASQTIVPAIPAQGQATAIFTWNSAFSTTTASIEVVPITPL